jgi:hypothetical protein
MTTISAEKIDVPDHIVSLLKICPEELCQPIYDLCWVMPKMVRMSEAAIRKKAKPNEVLDRLRLAFWDEVNRSIVHVRPFRLNQVIKGCCTRKQFFSYYTADRHKLMWIVTPPKSYALAMRQILNHSIRELERITLTPVTEQLKSPEGNESLNLMLNLLETNLTLIDGNLALHQKISRSV